MKDCIGKLLREAEFEGFFASYYVMPGGETPADGGNPVCGNGFGVGISEISPENVTREDFVCGIFPAESEAIKFAEIMADNGVLSDSLRDILRDYFAEKVMVG